MNLLFLTSNEQPKDGWSVVGYNIEKNLKANVDVFSSDNRDCVSFGKSTLKSELFSGMKGILFIFLDVLNIILKKDFIPDIIHCNVEFYAPVAMILSKIWNVPYTITAHGTYGVLLPTKYKLYKKAFENANKVICVSNFTKKRMIEENINCNFEVILNGVDKAKFKPNKDIKKENIITFVGNLKTRKGLRYLLDGMIKVGKLNSKIQLVIIGNINTKHEGYINILKFIKQNNLNVKFTGKITEKELIEYYQKTKLNILPSQTEPFYFEGFGLIHVEANACGTLTIGTKNSGNEDAIIDGNGYLVEYGNVEELSKKIIEIFEMKNYPEVNYSKLYDWKYVANQYEKLFRSIAK